MTATLGRIVAGAFLVLMATTARSQPTTVRPADLSKLSPRDFRDDELDIPYYLLHFHRVANSVALDGPRKGFIDIKVWRAAEHNEPFNARIMESILSLAYFYATNRPWNSYRADPAVRARLEAALDFWVRSQSPDGRFSEYAPERWSLAPTAFATKFMGETLRLLHGGPPIDSALHRRVIEAQRKAIHATLDRDDLYEHGKRFSNQFTNVFAGALAYLSLYRDDDMRAKLRKRIADGDRDHQSPVGYFYEADGPDWGYNLNTHHSNVHMAWHYARGTELKDAFTVPMSHWYEWLGYNAVPEPGSATLTLNRAIETRQRRPEVGEVSANVSFAGNPLAELVPAARVVRPTREEVARGIVERRRTLERRWPQVDSLTVGTFGAFSPYAFLHRTHARWYPTDAQRTAAIAAMPHQKRSRFTHQRTDSRKRIVYSYVRRPAYYAAFTGGEIITAQQRYGLGLVWLPGVGTVVQSQTGDSVAAWGTRAADSSTVYEARTLQPTYGVAGGRPAPTPGLRELGGGDLRIDYALGSGGSKALTFRDCGVQVAVTHRRPFVEQLPLLLLDSDSVVASAGSAQIRRGAHVIAIRWWPSVTPTVTRTSQRVGQRRVAVLQLPSAGSLRYDFLPAAGVACTANARPATRVAPFDVTAIERGRVLRLASRYLSEPPVTITAQRATRSAGGLHDYFSEGDYWWPDPANPEGPYIQRDGQTNPDNFNAHRDAMRRLSLIVPALTAAHLVNAERRYAARAVDHLRAWFIAESTRMNPHLLYAQAIKGRMTGRGVGIIDTIHLVEVARAAGELERLGVLRGSELAAIKRWFADYLTWMTTHQYGIDERNATNNHSAAWALQVAEFARFVGDSARLNEVRTFYKETLVPMQMAADGSFPREMGRTKPYGYALFQLDVMGGLTESLSASGREDLWQWTTPDGRGMRRAVDFMYPYIADKARWPKAPDVMYHDQWPVRHPVLFFAGRAYGDPRYIALWRRLEPDPTVDEVVRNYMIRQPLLWRSRATK